MLSLEKCMAYRHSISLCSRLIRPNAAVVVRVNDYQIVLTFPTAVTFGSAAVTPGPGATGSITGSPINQSRRKDGHRQSHQTSATADAYPKLAWSKRRHHDTRCQRAEAVLVVTRPTSSNASDVSLTKLKSVRLSTHPTFAKMLSSAGYQQFG